MRIKVSSRGCDSDVGGVSNARLSDFGSFRTCLYCQIHGIWGRCSDRVGRRIRKLSVFSAESPAHKRVRLRLLLEISRSEEVGRPDRVALRARCLWGHVSAVGEYIFLQVPIRSRKHMLHVSEDGRSSVIQPQSRDMLSICNGSDKQCRNGRMSTSSDFLKANFRRPNSNSLDMPSLQFHSPARTFISHVCFSPVFSFCCSMSPVPLNHRRTLLLWNCPLHKFS